MSKFEFEMCIRDSSLGDLDVLCFDEVVQQAAQVVGADAMEVREGEHARCV